MFKKAQQVVFAFLLFFATLHAQSVSVWTLDEQLSSNNLTVLRFRVQNTGQQTIHGLELRYRVKQEWSGIAPAESYYIPGGVTEWVQLGNGEAFLKISFPNAILAPMEELSNSSGFAVGLHANDWSLWNKQEHYSQPTSGAFTLTDRIPVYSNGILLNGEAVSDVACPEVWFLEVRKDSVKIGWMPSDSTEEQTILELHSFHGASREVNLAHAADSSGYMEWSGAFPVQHENHGELWLNCSGKMAAYFAYGLPPENAEPAVEAGLWDDELSFVRANMGLGYNMGISPEDRFIVEPEKFGRRIADWKLYRAWEAPDLQELPTIAFPGLGVAIMPETPNDSMLFAWTAVEGFNVYQLNIVRDSAYGDTLHSILVPGTKISLPMPPPGVYVWWAEPVEVATRGLWSSVKKIGKSVKKAVVTAIEYVDPIFSEIKNLDPILSNIIDNADDPISLANVLIPPIIKPPIGTFEIVLRKIELYKDIIGITPIRARKDTRMLDLGWALVTDSTARKNIIDSGWWDRPNLDITSKLREDEENRCWAITVQQMNRHFWGNLTQDEIVYHGKSHNPIENHFPHGLSMSAGGQPDEIIPTMAFALNIPGADLDFQDWRYKLNRGLFSIVEMFALAPGWFPFPPTPFTVISTIISGNPLAIAQVNQGYDGMHMMVIDGYKILADGSIYLRFVGAENEGTAEWRRYATLGMETDVFTNMLEQSLDNLADTSFIWFRGANFYAAYYIPPLATIGRMTDSRVHQDTDGDGIVDFDEIERFGTNYEEEDTDGDGIPDKMEITYYTKKGISADVDRDGLRAELDVDSDGDGDCDGDENANKDGEEDDGETNMMDPNSVHPTRRNCITRPIALLATEQININDRAYCTDGSNYCPIVSIGLGGGNAVQLGVSAKIGSILAGSSVWLRSNSYVFGDIHSAGDLLLQDTTPQVSGTIRQNDEEAFRYAQVYRSLLSILNARIPSGDMHIPSGQVVNLPPGVYLENIVVSSGSVLQLQPGDYQMGSLTVQSGGKIELLGSGSIFLDIVTLFRWDGSFQGNSIQDAASRLKLRVTGSQDIFLNTSFGGFLIAPRSHVIVGQAEKDYAGQIYAKRITMHQNTRFLWIPPGSWQSIEIATFNQGGQLCLLQ